jgi:acetyl esterase
MRKALDELEQTMRDMGLSDIHSGGVAPARAFIDETRPPVEDLPPIHSIENRTVPGPRGEIPVRIYRPYDEANLPVLMWFHGGGWVLGGLESAEHTCRTLANAVGCAVISVDYRLAPEVPFPGAIDDCSVATAWVAAHADVLGLDPLRIAVGGDSAGGNLAACVAYDARERGQQLAFQLLVYPVIEADFERASYVECAEGYLLTRDAMQWFWKCYMPDAVQWVDPRVSPMHAEDLAGLAPALIITAEYDPLRDEGEAYGAALAGAGVPVQVRRYGGVIHGFFGMVTEEPVAEVEAATRDAVAALRQALEME